ncbi:hypothetical protein ANN_18627 [Periplaneta americana]|uniref:Transposable element Tc3 transposase n=1 Tax=Periplaneta americana TaxID=6978 RepID=A0ABQ8SP95_PERAM|nr:hypothetical protein ANN_18627 [Periplaneta americana]
MENTEILLEASKAIGWEVNPEKTKYMIMSRDQNIVRNGNIKFGDSSFEEVEKFKYLGATVTNINDTREEIKRRINMRNACYYSVEKFLSSSLLSKNLKMECVHRIKEGNGNIPRKSSATSAMSTTNPITIRPPEWKTTVHSSAEPQTRPSDWSLPSKETLRGHSDSSFRGEGYIQCCVGVRLCDMYSNQELAEIHFMYGKAGAMLRWLVVCTRRGTHSDNVQIGRHLYVSITGTTKIYNSRSTGGASGGCEHDSFYQHTKGSVASQCSSYDCLETVERVPYQLYPYHLQRVQALSPADYPARVRFCQWFLQQCGINPNFPALVLFTDEAQFTRDGRTNFHNQHVWAYETVPSHHQVRFSLNMWAGIIGDRLVGPHVLVNRLTGQAYTNFLENTIPHVLEETPLINRQHIHFLHDDAPAHLSRTARRYLDRRFPDRWIGRGGPIAWPPRSPDLNPLDFYLWGHLKSLVYSSPVPDLESLRNRIVACSEDIRNTPGVWDRVRRSMRHRCETTHRSAEEVLERNEWCGGWWSRVSRAAESARKSNAVTTTTDSSFGKYEL